ncbi:hypothetical protein GCM10010964_41010 [Caldovatus sediminis]|jgi:uncharacterized membrane protein YgdD (TMEM256/DUF423 family)|uniref:DUF423 domain-containing protein n=1 Tax=Caldovatus sediminis TaxID=2041189 RepID=A0A8J3ECT7_9PROT|nr:DUF423 domain-containing protein [Caldovatus sediminis]GGG49527.1 hypothetical protein GCM10010964_41010 [Caldovatus sediminis]
MHRLWLAFGALFGLAAVALSAWAAHGLPQRIGAARMAAVQNALTMQGWHALALLATGLLAEGRGGLADAAGAAFVLGVLVFCGAVYAGAFGVAGVGRFAPYGGATLMLGWALLLLAAIRR